MGWFGLGLGLVLVGLGWFCVFGVLCNSLHLPSVLLDLGWVWVV